MVSNNKFYIPFTFSHLSCKFFQLLALSSGVFDLVKLLEPIATKEKKNEHKHKYQRDRKHYVNITCQKERRKYIPTPKV